ncbi:uncharacterized protein VDAG_00425 [Verticillium dahliae VdLs.17]|uniref:Uncharacterized protein n=1 Tax=Verticillium dahliae (strain VdLs.17 / ATCC MYA-4575 / FGSC 10137) TaxID=498257 RepID=G2WS92_VERDV|nr:uncharacterized protein VDAG_00425 [Verticillium dahliae VdLs.17]EGY13743.1 hypothetical protein VDAG_00425 [Verticillium dahliae VdLs.17]
MQTENEGRDALGGSRPGSSVYITKDGDGHWGLRCLRCLDCLTACRPLRST